MVLDVVEFVEESASVGFEDTWVPALIPGRCHIGERGVPAVTNSHRQIQRTIKRCNRLPGPFIPGFHLGRLERGVHAIEILQHLDILPAEAGDGQEDLERVTVEFDVLEVLVQQAE